MHFQCRPVDAAFIDRAPMKFRYSAELDADADRVFQMFEDPESWPRWFHGIRHVQWTSPRPFGVGTTRTVTLDTMTVHEHFFRWEPGRRFSFYFTGMSVPLARGFAEDYLLEPLDGGRCRFTYQVAVDPSVLMRLGGPVGRAILHRMFNRAVLGLQQYVVHASKAEPGSEVA